MGVAFSPPPDILADHKSSSPTREHTVKHTTSTTARHGSKAAVRSLFRTQELLFRLRNGAAM